MLLGATLAALAGISVEYMYKEEYHTSIHLQNTQLYAFGVVANGLVVLARDNEALVAGTAMRGFDELQAWLVVVTLALFGLVTALVVKHLSNIAKVFNSAMGIVVTAALSWVFLGTGMTLPFVLAATVVISSLFLFYADKAPARDGGKRSAAAGGVKAGGGAVERDGGTQQRGSYSGMLGLTGPRAAARSIGAVTLGVGNAPVGGGEKVRDLNHLL